MRTVVLGPPPRALEELIEERRRLGLDVHDELWEGEYHMAPATHSAHADIDQQLAVALAPPVRAAGLYMTGPVNIGEPDDFRVPDRVVHRRRPSAVWHPTAAIVIEIVSPDDETWQKLGFYAGHAVGELLIVDPYERRVDWLSLAGAEYRPAARSGLIELSPTELAARLDWPPLH
jgi:Uma2 family endonuclease